MAYELSEQLSEFGQIYASRVSRFEALGFQLQTELVV